ncbi:hypothetical protein CFC21_039669 [Triticum aestivum]|uniref:DUF6598 domain-containing protein n=2 Tax=Triticum aestivum TaxID=4565 RepID=A0A9R1FEK6_WHEAT|nr:uncharacterized protein LOC123064746 [Triticum aestivum]KAF7027642.1 hypothetical protein CFC21_039669 [Triticum aestivum]CDM81176.1 unnamed protein product [Triticum aestivum]
MQMEEEVEQRNQPRHKKNQADLADELEFFTDLRHMLMIKKNKEKEKGTPEKERFDSSNSYRSLGTQKGLGFLDNRIKVLRKRMGITAGTANTSPAISDLSDPSRKHMNGLSDLSSTLGADPISNDDDGADGSGDDEEEDKMECGKPAMEEEEVQRITGSTPISEIDAESVMEADAQDTDVSEKPDPIPTNTTAKVSINLIPFNNEVLDGADTDCVDDDEVDRGKSDAQLAREKRVMSTEELKFESFRRGWETAFSRRSGHFLNRTTVSSMQFTHLAPGRIPCGAGIEPAVQIFSVKLTEVKGGFKFPLSVYGVVAARDGVDYNRNLLFFCDRSNSQKLTQNDPYLRLIGPSRAVFYEDYVNYEVQLMVKGSVKSRDRPLITDTYRQIQCRIGVSTICFQNCFCTMELCLERFLGSVQATIFGVRVVKDNGAWPFGHGVRVACSPASRELMEDSDGEIKYVAQPSSGEILLLDSKYGRRPADSDGYLYLSRQVVSVEPSGQLEVEIQAYAPPGVLPAKAQVCFEAQECNIDRGRCCLLGAEVEICVAWSRLASDMEMLAGVDRDFQRDEPEVAFTQVGLNGEPDTERIF